MLRAISSAISCAGWSVSHCLDHCGGYRFLCFLSGRPALPVSRRIGRVISDLTAMHLLQSKSSSSQSDLVSLIAFMRYPFGGSLKRHCSSHLVRYNCLKTPPSYPSRPMGSPTNRCSQGFEPSDSLSSIASLQASKETPGRQNDDGGRCDTSNLQTYPSEVTYLSTRLLRAPILPRLVGLPPQGRYRLPSRSDHRGNRINRFATDPRCVHGCEATIVEQHVTSEH